MEFLAPDPSRYRISDCGRYLIEKIMCGNEPLYCVWQYNTQRGGYKSMEECQEAIMTREFHRFEAAAEVGTVGFCPSCGRPDGAPGSLPRVALESDF